MRKLVKQIRRAISRRRSALRRGDKRGAASALRVARRLRARLERRRVRKTVAFDGVPVPRGLALVLQDARDHGVRFRLLSADRRRGVAERFGKMSQAALYACWQARRPGCNPANPPGRSTHELRSDGVAYKGPMGRSLYWWQLGLDVDGSQALLEWLLRHGYRAKRPYNDPREAHHLNFVANPRRNYRRRQK